MSVTGCEYTPIVIGRANCSITVKGSWCRPTISIPNTRSDGARRTGAATVTMMIVASADTAATSAMRPGNADHRSHDQQRAGNRPAAHVAYMRGQARVRNEAVQRQQPRDLRQRERREAGGK